MQMRAGNARVNGSMHEMCTCHTILSRDVREVDMLGHMHQHE